MTYTYVVLRVSPAAYAEIREKLAQAGYQHAFHGDRDGEVIDMHGIALGVDQAPGQSNVGEVDPLSGREYCPRCGSGPRQREDVKECPDCGYRWAGPPLMMFLEPPQTGGDDKQ